MDSEVLNTIIKVLLPVLSTVITAIFSYVALKIKTLYTEKVTNEEIKSVVDDTVKYVEQVYTDIKGEDKLKNATLRVVELLGERGITISDSEIRTLIESAVYGINQGLTKTIEE